MDKLTYIRLHPTLIEQGDRKRLAMKNGVSLDRAYRITCGRIRRIKERDMAFIDELVRIIEYKKPTHTI